ncbi:MAG: plastocyanin/azurin family copper-binding protein [Pseudomonadota bacterium]
MHDVKRPTPTRRKVVQTIAAVCACGIPSASGAAAMHSIDQITDPGASAATNMFRFEPDFVRISPGESIAFLNSRGEHTVHSIPQFWPADRAPVAIASEPRAEVTFDAPGLYGFRCNRHGQYGMVMLVAVGQDPEPEDIDSRIEAMRARDREKTAFRALVERYRTT